MPTIFRCLNLRITMNPRGNEHNPPHVHAYYKEDLAIIDIKSGEIIPSEQYMIARRFIEENQDVLLELWKENPQDFDRF